MGVNDVDNLAASLKKLDPKKKAPTNARVLDGWIAQARDGLALDADQRAVVANALFESLHDKSGSQQMVPSSCRNAVGRICWQLEFGTEGQEMLPLDIDSSSIVSSSLPAQNAG